MNRPAGYVSADYLRKVAEAEPLRQIKEQSYRMMNVGPGQRVLDVGCGPATDTVRLGEVVGPSGEVIGIDFDGEMVAEANRRAGEQGVAAWVRHQVGEACPLPFDDAQFDGCRAERLLQVLPEPGQGARAVAEMVRVLKAGGWLVLADTDWGSASVDYSDSRLERRLLSFFAEQLRPNGFAGRELYRLCREQPLDELRIEVFPLIHVDPSLTPYAEWLPDEAEKAGVVTSAEVAAWKDELAERTRTGRFFAMVNMVVVAGRKR